jgi:hypothetical protein
VALAEKDHGLQHPLVMTLLQAAVESLVGAGQVARAKAFAERAHAMAKNLGPFSLANAELALARARAADPKDRPGAIALAQGTRARLAGTGYFRSLRKVETWLAEWRG